MIAIETVEDLFSPEEFIPKDLLKQSVFQHFKDSVLIGIPDAAIEVDFEPEDMSDILVRKIDPEKALGYRLFENEDSYFSYLNKQLYIPKESDFEGGE